MNILKDRQKLVSKNCLPCRMRILLVFKKKGKKNQQRCTYLQMSFDCLTFLQALLFVFQKVNKCYRLFDNTHWQLIYSGSIAFWSIQQNLYKDNGSNPLTPIQSLMPKYFGFFDTFPVIPQDGKLLQHSRDESACRCLYTIFAIFTGLKILTGIHQWNQVSLFLNGFCMTRRTQGYKILKTDNKA